MGFTKIKLFSFLLLFANCGTTPSSLKKKEFNGTITYKVSIDCKEYHPNLDAIRKQMGDSLKISFSNNKYYAVFNGSDKAKTWYDNEKGKQYSIINSKDTLYIDDAEKALRKLEDSDNTSDTESILGRQCYSFHIKTDGDETTYFYDPNIYISPERYSRHEFGFVNLYYQNCKAPFLKSVRISGNYTYTYTAVNIDTTIPSNYLFVIPSNLPHSSFVK